MLMQLLIRIVLVLAAIAALVITPAVIQSSSGTYYDPLGLVIDGVSIVVLIAVAASVYPSGRRAR